MTTRTPEVSSSTTRAGTGTAKHRSVKNVGTGAPDALALLKKDHKEVKTLFAQFEKLDSDTEKGELAEIICGMLTVHSQIEEEIFYPALRAAGVDIDTMDEAQVEHASAKNLIGQIEEMEPGDDLYDAKVKVLGEYINHHVAEEEGEMFKKARTKNLDFAELGRQLDARSAELKDDLGLS